MTFIKRCTVGNLFTDVVTGGVLVVVVVVVDGSLVVDGLCESVVVGISRGTTDTGSLT
jgi:hypothetical protein